MYRTHPFFSCHNACCLRLPFVSLRRLSFFVLYTCCNQIPNPVGLVSWSQLCLLNSIAVFKTVVPHQLKKYKSLYWTEFASNWGYNSRSGHKRLCSKNWPEVTRGYQEMWFVLSRLRWVRVGSECWSNAPWRSFKVVRSRETWTLKLSVSEQEDETEFGLEPPHHLPNRIWGH